MHTQHKKRMEGNKMVFFKKRKKNPQTRIVRRMTEAEVLHTTPSPLRSPIANVLQTRTFEVNHGEFNGFDSPPGRF